MRKTHFISIILVLNTFFSFAQNKIELFSNDCNEENGFQPEYGARPMKRLIRRDILAEISKYMLENPGQNSFQVDYDNGVMISQA